MDLLCGEKSFKNVSTCSDTIHERDRHNMQYKAWSNKLHKPRTCFNNNIEQVYSRRYKRRRSRKPKITFVKQQICSMEGRYVSNYRISVKKLLPNAKISLNRGIGCSVMAKKLLSNGVSPPSWNLKFHIWSSGVIQFQRCCQISSKSDLRHLEF